MNDANKETNAAYEEPKKKVYVKLLVFLVLITAIVVVLGAKFVSFYYKTHGIPITTNPSVFPSTFLPSSCPLLNNPDMNKNNGI